MSTPEHHEAPTQDLAANPPGKAARARAVELQRAAPVRTLVARALGVRTEERSWRVGADGEEEVARRLRKLGDAWHVIHAVPVGENGSDIDHVVIGPPGVFTLNTKNHTGRNVWVAEQTFMVNGQKTDYLRSSQFEARRASGLLSAACGFPVPVEPVIVVMAARMTVRAQPVGVHVAGWKRIARWLAGRGSVLPPERVEMIYGRARVRSTWQPAPV